MNKPIEQILEELNRLGYQPASFESNSSHDGIVLHVEEWRSQPEICRFSEIGPGGRVSMLYEARDLWAALKAVEPGESWYAEFLNRLADLSPSPPIQIVSPGGRIVTDTIPAPSKNGPFLV
jgi:hypothetical protein